MTMEGPSTSDSEEARNKRIFELIKAANEVDSQTPMSKNAALFIDILKESQKELLPTQLKQLLNAGNHILKIMHSNVDEQNQEKE